MEYMTLYYPTPHSNLLAKDFILSTSIFIYVAYIFSCKIIFKWIMKLIKFWC
jgi:hypothetical protein